jgi:LPXTG-motif cell wall-anchored protein
LSKVNAFDEASTGQSTNQTGGIEQWVLPVIIGLVVVALGLVLWFFLRRRRRLAELDDVLVAA